MFEYLFTFRSLTAAQSARRALLAEGIHAALGRTARQMSAHGCAYALRVSAESGIRALHVLRVRGAPFVHLYRVSSGGTAEEVRL